MSRKSGAFPARIRSNERTQAIQKMVRGSPSLHLFLGVCFPVASILANVLSAAIVVAVQLIEYKSVCSYPVHLFIDILAKVGDVKNATTVVQARINQILPEAF
jgi:hypothetical protein